MADEIITVEGDMMREPARGSEWNPATDATRTESLRALLDPSIAPLFWRSERAGTFSSWWRHVPFGQWLVLQARPRVLVELGTHAGVSYSAFCEAVLQGGLDTRCHAVDTWLGDKHSGEYGPDVYDEFRRYHDARFATFSTLLRCSFDEALGNLPDRSVDSSCISTDSIHMRPSRTISGAGCRNSRRARSSCCTTRTSGATTSVCGGCGKTLRGTIQASSSFTGMG